MTTSMGGALLACHYSTTWVSTNGSLAQVCLNLTLPLLRAQLPQQGRSTIAGSRRCCALSMEGRGASSSARL